MTHPPTPPPADPPPPCRRCGRPLHPEDRARNLEACWWGGEPACDRRAIDHLLARLAALEAAVAGQERQREYDRDRELERANPDDW
jgi:hypothetical protein